MQSQANPDGMPAHIEREVLDYIRKNAPKKKKFCCGSRGKNRHESPDFILQSESLDYLDKQEMKRHCEFVTECCGILKCPGCRRKEKMRMKQQRETGFALQSLEKLTGVE